MTPIEELLMPYVRVADFDADDAAIDSYVAMFNPMSPEGVRTSSWVTVLANREKRTMRVVLFFDTEDDLRRVSATLEGKPPPQGLHLRQTKVETFELLVQRQQ